MISITQTCDRSLALLLSVEKLTQEFEELKRLRNRVRGTEAKICGSRSQRRRKSPSGTLRRNKRRMR
jgi:hypothetical protein